MPIYKAEGPLLVHCLLLHVHLEFHMLLKYDISVATYRISISVLQLMGGFLFHPGAASSFSDPLLENGPTQ
jgi:hypothetical protein